MAYDNNLTGALFKNNDKREGKKDADYRGSAEIGGQKYWLNAWINKSKAGDTYMSLKFEPQDRIAEKTADKREPAGGFADDIPFAAAYVNIQQ